MFRSEFHKANRSFMAEYGCDAANSLLAIDKTELVTSEDFPTLLVAREAFGLAVVKTTLKSHLFQLAQAVGVSATESGIDAITDDIIHGYSDLRITEIIYAFRLMRESRFREGANQERDACQFYGTLSSQVVCNCLHRYRFEYRNQIIQQKEQDEHKQKMKEEEANAANVKQRDDIIFAACLRDLYVSPLFARIYTPKQMNDLQYYVDERKAHLLLVQRVKQFLSGTIDQSALQRGIEYIDKHFPVNSDGSADRQ